MKKEKQTFSSVEEYIAQFPPEIQTVLQAVRNTIIKSAPQAVEKISYQMPAYDFYGNLVYFAAHKNHLGFYPTPSGITAFEKQLSSYHTAKGSVQFPLNQPVPFELISEMVRFRVVENIRKAEGQSKKK